MEIGSKGLSEVNLTIPQGTSLNFAIVHKDEDGNVVDHSQSTAKMAFQTKGGANVQLDSCCTCTSEGVSVSVPSTVTAALAKGKMVWDMLVTTNQGEVLRLAYGAVSIVDTYAADGE